MRTGGQAVHSSENGSAARCHRRFSPQASTAVGLDLTESISYAESHGLAIFALPKKCLQLRAASY